MTTRSTSAAMRLTRHIYVTWSYQEISYVTMCISAGTDWHDATYTDEIARVAREFDYFEDNFFRSYLLDRFLDYVSEINVQVGTSYITNAVMQQKPFLGTKDRLLYAFIAMARVASMSPERTGELVLSKMRRC